MTDGDAASPSPASRRPWYFWTALAVLGVVVVVVIAAAVRPRAQDDYDDATRERFVAACTADGGEPVRSTCVCLYDEIVEHVPFDRFELLDDELATEVQDGADAPLTLPGDVQALLDECVAATN
jgi:hypothetical protein